MNALGAQQIGMKGVGVGGLIMQPTGNKPHGGFKRINQTHHRRKLLFFPGSAALQSAVLVFDMGLQFMDFKPLNAASGVSRGQEALPPVLVTRRSLRRCQLVQFTPRMWAFRLLWSRESNSC